MKFYISILPIPVILKVFPRPHAQTHFPQLKFLRENLYSVFIFGKKSLVNPYGVYKKKKNQKSQQIFCWARDSESFFKSHSMQKVRNAKTRKYLNNKHEAFSD